MRSVLKPGREQLSTNWPIRYYCASTRPQLKDLTRTFTRSSHTKITLAGGGQIWRVFCLFVFACFFFFVVVVLFFPLVCHLDNRQCFVCFVLFFLWAKVAVTLVIEF